MFVFIVRALWPLVRPILVVALIGAVCLAVLGFDPQGIVTEWLTNVLLGGYDWLTCEVIGWC